MTTREHDTTVGDSMQVRVRVRDVEVSTSRRSSDQTLVSVLVYPSTTGS